MTKKATLYKSGVVVFYEGYFCLREAGVIKGVWRDVDIVAIPFIGDIEAFDKFVDIAIGNIGFEE